MEETANNAAERRENRAISVGTERWEKSSDRTAKEKRKKQFI